MAAAAAAVAVIGTLVATANGPGLNPDSSYYLSAGLSLAEGDGLRALGGSPMTIFPPGLPAVVAVGDRIGLAPESVVRGLNGVAFGLTVVLGHLLLRRHCRHVGIRVAGTWLLALSLPLLSVAEMTWTESTFILLSLTTILLLEQVPLARSPWRWVAAAVPTVWLAFLFRYAGIALIASGAVTVYLALNRSRDRRTALLGAGIFSFASAVVPAGWMIRNRAVDGTLMGARAPSTDGPVDTVARFVAHVGRWLLPAPTPVPVQAVAGLLVLACVTALAVIAIASLRPTGARRHGAVLGLFGPERGDLLPLIVFTFVYSGYLIAAQLTTAFDQIGSRLMSPLFVPLVVILASGADRAIDHPIGHLRSETPRRVATLLLVLFVLAHGVLFAQHARVSARDGLGYASASWQDSELASAAGRLPSSATIYSNAPAGLWAATRREPLLRAPERRVRRSDLEVPLPDDFLTTVACQTPYLVWFDDIPGSFLYSPSELREFVQVEPVQRSPDGALFRLRPMPGQQCGD